MVLESRMRDEFLQLIFLVIANRSNGDLDSRKHRVPDKDAFHKHKNVYKVQAMFTGEELEGFRKSV